MAHITLVQRYDSLRALERCDLMDEVCDLVAHAGNMTADELIALLLGGYRKLSQSGREGFERKLLMELAKVK